MTQQLAITEGPENPELNRRMSQYRRNGEWLTEQSKDFFEAFRGSCIAISEGEVFVAEDAAEARRLAKAKHPGDEPFVQSVQKERCERIYVC